MTENEKINGWTFEETVKTAENLMESEQNMFKWDVLRHLRDFAESFREELGQYRAIGTPEECQAAMEKQEMSKIVDGITECCGYDFAVDGFSREIARYCPMCGRKLDWSDEDGN